MATYATLQIPGNPDFLVSDGDDVWITNQGRVERLRYGEPNPITTVRMPRPAGAMAMGFGALWVASVGKNRSWHRINRDTGAIDAVIPTGLADPSGELSVAVGAGSVWLLRAGILLWDKAAFGSGHPKSFCRKSIPAAIKSSSGMVRPLEAEQCVSPDRMFGSVHMM